MFRQANCRSERRSVFAVSPLSNRFLLLAAAAALLVHGAALYVPATQFVLRVVPIEAWAWARMVLVVTTIVATVEMHTRLRRGA